MLKLPSSIFILVVLVLVAGCRNNIYRDAPQFVCSPVKMFSCNIDQNNCDQIPIASFSDPLSITLDPKTMKTTSREGEQQLSTTQIGFWQQKESIILSGGFGLSKNQERLAWSGALDQTDNKLTLSAMTDGYGYVIFAECQKHD